MIGDDKEVKKGDPWKKLDNFFITTGGSDISIYDKLFRNEIFWRALQDVMNSCVRESNGCIIFIICKFII